KHASRWVPRIARLPSRRAARSSGSGYRTTRLEGSPALLELAERHGHRGRLAVPHVGDRRIRSGLGRPNLRGEVVAAGDRKPIEAGDDVALADAGLLRRPAIRHGLHA